MILRRISERDAPEAADFLDAHTMLLRWLVAFLRHLPSLPQEEEEAWSLLRGDTAAEGGLAGVFAHYFRTATTYACVAPEADLADVERLVQEEFLPERLVLDEPLLTRWKAASPALFRRAAQQKEIRVFISTLDSVARGEPAGFRAATRCDLPVLEEQERLLEVETGQELASDLESLLEHELLSSSSSTRASQVSSARIFPTAVSSTPAASTSTRSIGAREWGGLSPPAWRHASAGSKA